jgi:hypothetical protein
MLGESPRPFLFRPIEQAPPLRFFLMVRGKADLTALAGPIRSIVSRMDPGLPLENVRSLRDHLNQSGLAFMPLRMGLSLAALQGMIGLLLGVMGLYAVVFFVARQRFREFGLRIALGAPPREILRLVIGDGMRPAIWGAVLGLLMAIGVGWVMSRLLFGIRPFELSVVLPVLALLAASALAACWFPARWAARVDPIKALRHE